MLACPRNPRYRRVVLTHSDRCVPTSSCYCWFCASALACALPSSPRDIFRAASALRSMAAVSQRSSASTAGMPRVAQCWHTGHADPNLYSCQAPGRSTFLRSLRRDSLSSVRLALCRRGRGRGRGRGAPTAYDDDTPINEMIEAETMRVVVDVPGGSDELVCRYPLPCLPAAAFAPCADPSVFCVLAAAGRHEQAGGAWRGAEPRA